VILDLMLPRGGGFELLANGALIPYEELPIFVLTSKELTAQEKNYLA